MRSAFKTFICLSFSLYFSLSSGAPTSLSKRGEDVEPMKRLTPDEIKVLYEKRRVSEFGCKEADINAPHMKEILEAFDKLKYDASAHASGAIRGGFHGSVINHPHNTKLEIHKRFVVKTLDDDKPSVEKIRMELDGLTQAGQLEACETITPPSKPGAAKPIPVFYITQKKIEGPTLEEVGKPEGFAVLKEKTPESDEKWGMIGKAILDRLRDLAKRRHIAYLDINVKNIKVQGRILEPGKFAIGVIDWGYAGWRPMVHLVSKGASQEEQDKELESYMKAVTPLVTSVVNQAKELARNLGSNPGSLTTSPHSPPPKSLENSPHNSNPGSQHGSPKPQAPLVLHQPGSPKA
ncbi:hypothetical protein CVT24_006319 [Panaeolus cyanescens]|uniref:Protein kinase domain-containing protein n=1 Tax=Panaeolus cyanescens TaxID=181874 RepID=A0A409YEE3_9AGAR|nr:hypothetical protein CVT24_006319 [Panaeolus cyanescens]